MRWRVSVAALCVLLFVIAAASGGIWGAFSGKTTNAGSEIRTVADYVAPAATFAVLQKSEGGVPGFIRPGGSARALAVVADSGRPSSGIASVTANADGVGTFATLLANGTSVEGRTYNYVSPNVGVSSTYTNGTFTFGLDLRDGAGNAAAQTGFPVTVDGTAPTATDIRAVNKSGGIAGRPETGDQVEFTYSEEMESNSYLSGWNGSATNVVAFIDANGGASNRNLLSIRNAANNATLPLGSVDLGSKNYVAGDRTFGASGTASTMVRSAGLVTVTLGTASGTTSTVNNGGSLVWTPNATATDRAGNPATTTARTGSNGSGRDF